MRVFVCGGRDFVDREAAFAAIVTINAEAAISLIIEGGARGADRIARDWALSRGVRHAAYPAGWAGFGRSAGPIRNQRMPDEGLPDLVAALHGGRGTGDMIARAEDAGVRVVRPLG